ncbi:MAG TPA: class I SAM-dependent DNA methyltransferase [Candidatus Baltobacteraceae bacterium]|nr:class I SAM-dependent DNA methyltransferase [Candidatus Baltobacteraceae bacterium]
MNNGTTNGTSPNGKAQNLASFIWSVADLLRGDYKPADYGTVILPFTVLRRLDCVLEKSKSEALKVAAKVKDIDNPRVDEELRLQQAAGKGFKFYNISKFDLSNITGEPTNLNVNLENYVAGFSANVRDIFGRYKFDEQIATLHKKNLLFKVVQRFASIDLHPNVVSPHDMGLVFEELIRKFADASNETAGDHFTPRDAIRLMVDLVLHGDDDLLQNKAPLRTIYDPTAGTGGMLSVAEERIKEYNAAAKITAFAQELNDESYAICKGDMLIKGQDISNVVQGNTLTDDAFVNQTFDYMFSNPPYGVDWKKIEEPVRQERSRGEKGRFAPGLPRVSDGQMLFLLHLVSKMRPLKESPKGSRIAIVMNGSPLFSGGAGSGESEIRRRIIEKDWLEAIIALPSDMFYNTGISTYIWILTNNKSAERKGKVQLINAVEFFQKMRRSLGSKRRELGESDIRRIVEIHGAFEDVEFSKILSNEEFGYRTITLERPLRLNFQASEERIARLDAEAALTKNGLDLAKLKEALRAISADLFTSRVRFLDALAAALKTSRIALKPQQHKAVLQALSERDEGAETCMLGKGKVEPDPLLRDTENVPLSEDVSTYFRREVKPYAADSWIDESKTKIGYEIPFVRHFYKYVPPRPLAEIDKELSSVTSEIVSLLTEMSA